MPEIPPAGQVVPEAVMPVGSVNIGRMPGEVSSVEPSGMPVGPTDVPACEAPDMPSGEVAEIPGVGPLIPPTWAKAVQEPSIAIAAANQRRLILCLQVRARRLQAASRLGGAIRVQRGW
jgi:hypothetical protein